MKTKKNAIIGKWVTERYIVNLFSSDRVIDDIPVICHDSKDKEGYGQIYWGGSNKRHLIPSFTETKDGKTFAKRAIRRLQKSMPNHKLSYRLLRVGVVEG